VSISTALNALSGHGACTVIFVSYSLSHTRNLS
jgi:hypothetical protein